MIEELLLTRGDVKRREAIADRISAGNRSVAKAWLAKAAAAFSRGEAENMIRWQREAIRLDRYSPVEYEQYFDWLYLYIQLYLQDGMTESAAYCRELLLEIPALLAETEAGTSEPGRRIYDKPELELSEEYREIVEALQDGQ